MYYKKIILYLLGGVVTYSLKTGITFTFTDLLMMQYWVSYIYALIAVILFGFFYNFHITFNNKTQKRKKFIAYTIILFTFMVIDYSLVIFLTSFLLVHYLISIILVTGFLVIIKFFIYNSFIFRKKQKLSVCINE